MFVADDLVGWLVGRLADAGYKKLSTRLRGTDQNRALKEALTAAVQTTVREIGPSEREEAERVARQIDKAFHRREPVPQLAGEPSQLEALQNGITRQLSALDDTGQTAVSLLGVSVTVVARSLTEHLVHEITDRGAEGGPLFPLAVLLGQDRAYQLGEQIKGMVAELLERDAPAPAAGAAGPVGWPLAEVADPFALEVHRPVEPDVPQAGLPVLPVYVPRVHDAALAEVVTAAADGTSGIAVLVGGSSTGKTRACWQALELLRGLEPGWRLWHPIDPQAALAGLPGAGPRTAVWLNEAQRYLDSSDGTGERVAAGLRALLWDRARGPVLVLATLWPQFWDELTARPPPGVPDPHAQARELLDGHDISVPTAFTGEQLRQLEEAGDPRLALAAAGSRDGQVIQYLAGAPELLDRYHNAPPAARALIDAAIDAHRLGMRPALPQAFLQAAAPGYLTDTEWELQPPDWLGEGLGYTAKPAKGVRGPLAPVRPRPAPGVQDSPAAASAWQLADYLDQYGRRARRELMPPAYFWAAAASYADPADLGGIAGAAEVRGLYRDAARLYKQASAHGDPIAGANLVRLLHTLHPGDQRPADWAAAYASLDDPNGVAGLLGALREAGASGQVAALLDRDPATHASLDDPNGVAGLLGTLDEAGATGQVNALATRVAAHASLDDPAAVTGMLYALLGAGASGQVAALLDRDPATHVRLHEQSAVAQLLGALDQAGATGQVNALLDRDLAAHASLDDPFGVPWLLDALRRAGASSQVDALATRIAAHVSLDDPFALYVLLNALDEAGASGQVGALATRVAAHASLDNPNGVADLLDTLRAAKATGQVAAFLDRDPAAHVSLGDPFGVAHLLDTLRKAGASGQVAALLDRDPATHASLDNPNGVAELLRQLREAEANGQVAAFLDRDPAAHVSLDNPNGVADLLDTLRAAKATRQAIALLARDPAAHVSLGEPGGVARLLGALHEAGATDQVTTLAGRTAAHVSLDNPYSLDESGGVADLLSALNEAGEPAHAAELIERLPAAGMFELFRKQEGRGETFRFGRGADGRPAKRWAWTDLG